MTNCLFPPVSTMSVWLLGLSSSLPPLPCLLLLLLLLILLLLLLLLLLLFPTKSCNAFPHLTCSQTKYCYIKCPYQPGKHNDENDLGHNDEDGDDDVDDNDCNVDDDDGDVDDEDDDVDDDDNDMDDDGNDVDGNDDDFVDKLQSHTASV